MDTNTSSLQFPPRQIQHHLPTRNPRRPPQRRKIQRARQPICKAKPQHRRNPAPRVLKCKARALHLVLLDRAAMKMVHGSLRVDFRFISARGVSELRAGDDVEVVVGGVPACVTFCTDCCA